MPLKDFKGVYTPQNHPSQTGIDGNGFGWEPDTGIASNVICLIVDEPEFIELQVSRRRTFNGEAAYDDIYRAQIDGLILPLRAIAKNDDMLKVSFTIPDRIRSQKQIKTLFLCFSDGYDGDVRNSERFLLAVCWR